MIFFILFFILGYGLFLIWLKTPLEMSSEQESLPNEFTLLIPFKNEKANLENIITHLERILQQYQNSEIIFINDHSTDGGEFVLSHFIEKNKNVKCINSKEKGKKSAISLGVSRAQNELILCTDADCNFSLDWPKEMLSPFKDEKIKMVCGLVKMKGNSILQQQFALEFMSLVFSGYCLWKKKKPIMANGANMAFRKTDFIKLNPYKDNLHIKTGDDEFLLNAIVRQDGSQSVFFQPSMLAVVETTAPTSIKQFMKQRIRWASKAKEITLPWKQEMAVMVFLFQCLFLILGLVLIIKANWLLFLVLLLIKMVSDYGYFKNIAKHFEFKKLLLHLAIIQVWYPIYIVEIGIYTLTKKTTNVRIRPFRKRNIKQTYL